LLWIDRVSLDHHAPEILKSHRPIADEIVSEKGRRALDRVGVANQVVDRMGGQLALRQSARSSDQTARSLVQLSTKDLGQFRRVWVQIGFP
jgi:hypothetical protein